MSSNMISVVTTLQYTLCDAEWQQPLPHATSQFEAGKVANSQAPCVSPYDLAVTSCCILCTGDGGNAELRGGGAAGAAAEYWLWIQCVLVFAGTAATPSFEEVAVRLVEAGKPAALQTAKPPVCLDLP